MNFNFLNRKNMETVAERDGFTLLEVIVAISILLFIALGISQATTQTFKLRDVLTNEGDFYNGIRLAMSIMQRDIASIYSPHLLIPEALATPLPPGSQPSPADLDAMTFGDNNVTTQFWHPVTDKIGIRRSRFIGSDSKFSFISVSHIRVYKDSPESDFSKVSYELTADPDAPSGTAAQALLKTESPNAFHGDDSQERKFRTRYLLIHGVGKFKCRYYRKEKGQWENSWDSDREELKFRYPDIIEVTLEVSGPSRLNWAGKYRFRPEVPLDGLEPST